MPAETLAGLLEHAARHPEVPLAVTDRRERDIELSWTAIRQDALAACAGLQTIGVEPGDRVGLVYPTGFDFLTAFFSVVLAGAVPVPLYPPVRLGRLEEYLERTAAMLKAVGTAVVLADSRVARLIGPAALGARPRLGVRSLHDLPQGSATPVDRGPDDLALVQFSSGTTVEPKPVALTHRAVVGQSRLLNGLWPDTDELHHSGVSWLPLYHDMGLIGCILPALERPGPLTLIPPEHFVTRPAIWLRAISRRRATISPAPNFAFGLAFDKIRDEELDGVDLSSWRVALCGAEPIAPEVLRSFQRRFARWGLRPEALTPVYGLSEAALAVTFSDPYRPFTSLRLDRTALAERGEARLDPAGREIVSVGRPLPGFALRIVDEDGGDLPEGRVGRVLVSGPTLMSGYLNRPDLTAATLDDGWLDTGDLGILDHRELFLTGRKKDVLILNGRNHGPDEAERAAASVEGARPGCAVAASWQREGAATERLLLLVEARATTPVAHWDLVRTRASQAVVRETGLVADDTVVVAPGSLPRTSSGKLRRQEALHRWLAGRLGPPAEVGPVRLAGAMVRSRRALAQLDRDRKHRTGG